MTLALSTFLPIATSDIVECEMSLLATLIFGGGKQNACEGLEPVHFAEALLARIYDAYVKQAESGSVQPIILAKQFSHDESLAELKLTASQFFANLAANANIAAAVPHLARQIKNDYGLRQLAEYSDKLKARAIKPESGDTAEIITASALEALSSIIQGVGGASGRNSETTLCGAMDAITTRLNDIAVHGLIPDSGSYPGSQALTGVIGTWKRGRYYVLGARPGMGKSTLATSWLARTAMRGGNVLFFSLEMTADEIGERILSDIAFSSGHIIPYVKINRHEVASTDLENLLAASEKAKAVSLDIVDRPALTLAQVRSIIMRKKQALEANGKRLDVVCIDHIGLMKASERYAGNKVAETEEISISLKAMAKEFDCAFLVLAQLNRESEKREDKRPSLSDLRWSGSIEQDADVVMFAYRPAYHLERKKSDNMEDDMGRKADLDQCRNDLEIIFAKHRGGPCPVLELFCDMSCSAVRDKK